MNYGNMAKAVRKAVERYGFTVKVKSSFAMSYDPVTDTMTGTESTRAMRAMMNHSSAREVNGTTILAGDIFLTIAGGEAPPKMGDTLEIVSTPAQPVEPHLVGMWTVVGIETAAPAGVTISHKLQVRR